MSLPPITSITLPAPVDVSRNDDALAKVRAVIDAGPYTDTWDSLAAYTPPLWYHDARFGIFLHWGLYSVPAFNSEWYSRNMYLEGTPEFQHHVETYGPHKEFGYKDFIPSFTMENFDPDRWAELFRQAGAQYVVPVAEHHDGFALYDTKRSRWNAVQMGPRRDVLGDLLDAVGHASMVRGASSHRAEHWFFMNGGARFDSDVLDPQYADFYGPAQREETAPSDLHLQDWVLRTVEIIDTYRPQVLWFDWWIEHPAFEPWRRILAAYYYNRAAEWNLDVVIVHKWDAFPNGSAVYAIERGTMGGIRPDVWQNDAAVSRNSWCWVNDHQYKSADDLVAELADTVSKNGNLLLNIGPKPDGTIAEEEASLLRALGGWLSRNGEAIYGSRPWKIATEGPTEPVVGSFVDAQSPDYTAADIRFTTRTHVTGDYVYAILLAEPEDRTARINAFGRSAGLLGRGIRAVTVLGSTENGEWTQSASSLEVQLPASPQPVGGPVVKIFLEPPTIEPRIDFLHG